MQHDARRHSLLRSSLAPILALFATAACNGDSPTDPPDGTGGTSRAVSLEATPTSLVFNAVGDSARLTAIVRDAAGGEIAGAAVAWTNTDPAVATVNGAGWVTAVGNGTAAVVASAATLADTVEIDVAQAMAALDVSPSAVSVGEGDTVRLEAVVTDSNGVAVGGAPAVAWTSADEAVATVDDSGLVTGVGRGGETRITAAAGGLSGEVAVSVPDQLAFASDRDGNSEIYVTNADGSGLARLTFESSADSVPVWSPDGSKIAFASDRESMDIPGRDFMKIFVMNADGSGVANLTPPDPYAYDAAWSPDGSRIAFVGTRGGAPEFYVMNADGSGVTPLAVDGAVDQVPAWSPDGSRIAFESFRDNRFEIDVINADGSGLIRLTDGPGVERRPAWSPDGSRIAFYRYDGDNFAVSVMNADGSDPTDLTDDGPANFQDSFVPAWSPDGSQIAFVSDRDGDFEIYVINADGSGQTRLTNDAGEDVSPVWSPDGSRIAFQSDRDGNNEIYVMNADGSGLVNLTNSAGDDRRPVWRPRP